MASKIEHDALGTHVDWRLDGMTQHMIVGLRSNMELDFIL